MHLKVHLLILNQLTFNEKNVQRCTDRCTSGKLDDCLSVVLVQLEDGVDGLVEVAGDLEGEDGGGDVFARFDGVDGVAADADGIGQLLLGDVQDCPFYAHGILHSASSFLERQSIHLKTR